MLYRSTLQGVTNCYHLQEKGEHENFEVVDGADVHFSTRGTGWYGSGAYCTSKVMRDEDLIQDYPILKSAKIPSKMLVIRTNAELDSIVEASKLMHECAVLYHNKGKRYQHKMNEVKEALNEVEEALRSVQQQVPALKTTTDSVIRNPKVFFDTYDQYLKQNTVDFDKGLEKHRLNGNEAERPKRSAWTFMLLEHKWDGVMFDGDLKFLNDDWSHGIVLFDVNLFHPMSWEDVPREDWKLLPRFEPDPSSMAVSQTLGGSSLNDEDEANSENEAEEALKEFLPAGKQLPFGFFWQLGTESYDKRAEWIEEHLGSEILEQAQKHPKLSRFVTPVKKRGIKKKKGFKKKK